jgi:hypothetical protein
MGVIGVGVGDHLAALLMISFVPDEESDLPAKTLFLFRRGGCSLLFGAPSRSSFKSDEGASAYFHEARPAALAHELVEKPLRKTVRGAKRRNGKHVGGYWQRTAAALRAISGLFADNLCAGHCCLL